MKCCRHPERSEADVWEIPGSRVHRTRASPRHRMHPSDRQESKKGTESMTEPTNKQRIWRTQKPGWYVVQVRTGQEDRMCEVVRRVCDEYDDNASDPHERVNLRECFNPRFKSQRKRKGQFHDVEYPMLPGYVIADVDNPAMLAHALRSVRELCRVLAAEETYVPLNDNEREWVETQTRPADRVFPLSFGYKEWIQLDGKLGNGGD